jgi:hypothetical protein
LSPPQFPLLEPVAPLPDELNTPVGPDVFEVTFCVTPTLSLKVPDVTTVPDTVADPAVPAVLVRKGPCTPPPLVAVAPPPPVNVNKDPAEDT